MFTESDSLGLSFHISELGIIVPIQRIVARIKLNMEEPGSKEYETLGSSLILELWQESCESHKLSHVVHCWHGA